MHYTIINKASHGIQPSHCRDNPHEVERRKLQVREMSLSKFSAVELVGKKMIEPREPMVYKIMRAR